jgi:transcriptional accessory protein Tex/SPT6
MSDEKKTPSPHLPWLKNHHQAQFLLSKVQNRSHSAQNLGLSAFAELLWSQQAPNTSLEVTATPFLAMTPGLTSTEAILENTGKILTTLAATSEKLWHCVEKYYRHTADVCTHTSPHKILRPPFLAYHRFRKPYAHLKESELLTILQGAQENVLKVSLAVDDYDLVKLLCETFITTTDAALAFHLSVAITEAYHHFLAPSVTAVLLADRFWAITQRPPVQKVQKVHKPHQPEVRKAEIRKTFGTLGDQFKNVLKR